MTRTPPPTDGSLALKLDFGMTTTATRRWTRAIEHSLVTIASVPAEPATSGKRRNGPAVSEVPKGPGRMSADKYAVLEHRRRQAQLAARRLLDGMEGD